MRVKRFVYLAVIGALVVIVLIANTFGKEISKYSNNQKSNIKTNIKFYYIGVDGSNDDKALKSITSKFNQSQDRINVIASSGISVDRQMVAIMSGKSPDISHTLWPNAIRWAQNGYLEPLDDYIKQDHFDIEDFLPATVERASYNGTVYAMPFDINTMALYYNVGMLKSAGFDHPPKTMSELKDMAKALTKTDKNGRIINMGFLPDYPWLDNVLWPILFGAKFYDLEKNEVTTTSPEYVSAIEFQNWFYKEWDWDEIFKFKLKFGINEQEPFYAGKLAMVMGGDWIPNEAREYAPNMNLGVCPFPYPDNRPDLKDTSMITTSVFYIPQDSKEKEYAWEFMKYLVSKTSMLEYIDIKGTLTSRKSVLQDPIIKENPDLRLLGEFALNNKTRGFPPLPIVDEYLESLTEQTKLVFKQKITPYEAMLNVKKKVDPLLKNNK